MASYSVLDGGWAGYYMLAEPRLIEAELEWEVCFARTDVYPWMRLRVHVERQSVKLKNSRGFGLDQRASSEDMKPEKRIIRMEVAILISSGTAAAVPLILASCYHLPDFAGLCPHDTLSKLERWY